MLFRSSIKGAAGNLSIHDVFLDSDTLETAIKINRLIFVDLLLDKLEQSLEQSFKTILSLDDSIKRLLDSEITKDESFQMLTHLNLLETLIDSNDVEAISCIDDIVKQANGLTFAEKALELKKIIDKYDYDHAKTVFDELNLLIRKELKNGK